MRTADYIQITISIIMRLSFVFLIKQVYLNKKEVEYSNFVTTLKYYDDIKEDRQDMWKLIKKTVGENQATKDEVNDKQNTLSYLMIRTEQKEPLFAIEHGLLEQEIRSLNLLNELCRIAKKERKTLLLLTHSSDISYYQKRKDDLLNLYAKEKNNRKFSKPTFDYLDKFDVSDYFDTEI